MLHDCANRNACRLACDEFGNGVDQSLFQLQHGIAPQQRGALGTPLSLDLSLVGNKECSAVRSQALCDFVKALPQSRNSFSAFDLHDSGLSIDKGQQEVRRIASATA